MLRRFLKKQRYDKPDWACDILKKPKYFLFDCRMSGYGEFVKPKNLDLWADKEALKITEAIVATSFSHPA